MMYISCFGMVMVKSNFVSREHKKSRVDFLLFEMTVDVIDSCYIYTAPARFGDACQSPVTICCECTYYLPIYWIFRTEGISRHCSICGWGDHKNFFVSKVCTYSSRFIIIMKFINIIAIAFLQAARASNNVVDGATATAGGNAQVVRQLANETETSTASTVVTESSESEVAVTTTAAAPAEVDPAATADGFTALDGDFSMISSLEFGGGGPKATIQPSTVSFVSIYPDVDFVTLDVFEETLTISFDGEAVEGKSPRIRIGLPPDQVKSFKIGSSAEILNGFTSVEKLEVDPITEVQADLSSTTNPDLQVLVPVLAQATVIADVVGYAKVGLSGDVTIQAETVSEVMVDGSAKLTVDGNVGSGSVTTAASLSVTGDIEGHIDASQSARINANTISGSVTLSWSASASASSCQNVKTDVSSPCKRGRFTSGGPLGSSTTIASSVAMMFATLLVL